jgi:hypothetical protein
MTTMEDNNRGGALSSTLYYTGTGGTIHVRKAIEARMLTIQSSLRGSGPGCSMSDQSLSFLAIVVSSGNGGGGSSEARLVVNKDGEDHHNAVLFQPWPHCWDAINAVFGAPC